MAEGDQERWDARWRERGTPGEPSPVLVGLARWIPSRGRALDVAGGAGRNAIWLADRGLDVTIADISPEGLSIACAAASSAGVSLRPLQVDLERDPLPAGPWDLIFQHHYLHRPLFAAFADALAPGGTLVVVHPTRRNLERHAHPSARFLLEEGELPGIFSLPAGLRLASCVSRLRAHGSGARASPEAALGAGKLGRGALPSLVSPLRVVHAAEGWSDDRHEAVIVAVKG